MRRHLWLKIVLSTLGVLILALVLGLAFLHTDRFREYALSRLRDYLFETQGIRLQAGEIDYNLLTLKASLKNVRAQSEVAPNMPPFLVARRLDVDFGTLSLIRGFLHVESARAEGAQVHIYIDKDGRTNLPTPVKKEVQEASGGLPDFMIEDLLIPGASVTFEDRSHGIHLKLPDTTLQVTGQEAILDHLIQVRQGRRGEIALDGRTLPIDILDIKLRVPADLEDATLEGSRFITGKSEIRTRGTVNNLADPTLNLVVDASVDAAPLADFAGLKEPISGRVSGEARIQDRPETLRVDANLSGQRFSFRKFHDISFQTRSRWNRSEDRVVVDSLDVKSPDGSVRATADVRLAPGGQSRANVEIDNANLGAIGAMAGNGFGVASRASGDLELRWKGTNPESAEGKADLKLHASRSRAARNLVPLSGSFQVERSGQTAKVRIRRAQTLNTVIQGDVTVNRLSDLTTSPKGNVTGNLRADSQDIAVLLADLAAFLGRQAPLVGTHIAGPMNVDVRLGGSLANPIVDSQAQLPDTQVGNLRGVSLVAATAYSGDTLRLDDVTANWKGEILRVAGRIIGLRSLDPKLDLRANVDRASVETFARATGRDLPVSGTLSLQASATGSVQDPVVQTNMRGEALNAYGEPLGDLAVLATLRDRLVRLEELKLTKPAEAGGGELIASGSYNLDTRQYHAEAATRDFKLVGLSLGQGMPIRGPLELNASGTGTIDNPSADLQLRSDGLEVQGRPVGPLLVNARAENQKVALDVRAERYRASASGEVQIPAPHQTRFRVSAQGTNLALLPVPAAESGGLRGNFTGEIDGEGELSNWKEGSIRASVGQMVINVNRQQIMAKTPMEIRYQNGLLEVPSAEITSADSRLTVKGALPLRPDAASPGLELQGRINLATVKNFLPPSTSLAASGVVELDARLTGSLEQLNPEVSVSLANGRVETPSLHDPLTDLALRARLESGNLLLQTLSARLGAATINAQGKIPLGLLPQKLPFGIPQASGEGNLVADVNGFRLESLASAPEDATGQITAHAELRAAAARLEAVTGSVRFDQLQLRLAGYDLAQQGQSRITLQGGEARVDAFRLTGTGTEMNLTGSVKLPDRTLDLTATGQADLGLIELASENVDAAGPARFEVQARGPMSLPEVNGFLEVTNGQVSADRPSLQLTDLNTRVGMAGHRVTIERLQGTANGGALTGTGHVELSPDRPARVSADVNVKGFFLEYPENLRTSSDVQLQVRADQQGEGIVLGGQVRVLEGSYTESIGVGEEILDLLQTSSGVELTKEQNPLLARLKFNLNVDTQNPIAVDNNLAEVLATADLRLTGSYYRPGLTGRLSLEEGGELHLRERNYVLERGIATFLNETRIEPTLDVSATTEVDNYDITLQLSGSPDDLETTLTSDPPLPEPDIISMLVTGRRLEDLRGEEFEVAKEQTLSLLTGGVARRLSSGLEEATGLSQVRIEPNLIASESEPSARLTVGQDLSNDLELIYSMNLTDSSDQIYIAEYDVTDRFTGRVLHHTGAKTTDADPTENSYRLEFTHELLFGGAGETGRPEKSERKQPEIRKVSFSGTPVLPVSTLEDEFDVETEQEFDFFEVRKGLDRLREYYIEQGRLEARVRLHRKEEARAIDLNVEVTAGPEVSFAFQGAPVPEDVQKRVREVWSEGFFDSQRIDDSKSAIRAHFVEQNYLQAEVKPSVSQNGDRKLVTFDLKPGVAYSQVDVTFEGAKGIEPDELKEPIEKADLDDELRTNPDEVRKFLERYYYDRGFLDAEVEDVNFEFQPDAGRARIVVQILEGRRAQVHLAGIRGNSVYSEAEILKILRLKEGDNYNPQAIQDSIQAIEEVYWRKGFNDVVASFVSSRAENGTVNLTFNIEENKQHIVREVVVNGRDETSERFVRNQLELKLGDVLDRDKVALSRRNLYDTRAFALVDIRTEEIQTPPATEREQPMRLEVSVREVRPFEFRYGGSYDTERGVGLLTSIENRNTLGKARVLGARARYDGETREGRLYFSQPLLRSIPIETSVVGFGRRDIDNAAGFTTQRLGVSLHQEMKLKNFYVLSYGYRFERTRTVDHEPGGFGDLSINLAPLSATLTRDTRDDLLDASRGSFNAHAFEYAPSLLGSQLRYIRYFGQYFKYIPLQRPREVPWSGGDEKARLVYAGAIRVGLAQGLGGQELIPGERFFAGGESTVRGFRKDALGPIDVAGFAKGGEAVFIFNNEIRFPMISIFDGVGFIDIGNVYKNVSDFNPFDVRGAAGFGLRVRTPYFLLRADYGMKLSRREGESAGAFFFSIGQAF